MQYGVHLPFTWRRKRLLSSSEHVEGINSQTMRLTCSVMPALTLLRIYRGVKPTSEDPREAQPRFFVLWAAND